MYICNVSVACIKWYGKMTTVISHIKVTNDRPSEIAGESTLF